MASATHYPQRWLASEPTSLILQPTSLCNLDCTYCYLPARKLKRDMSPAVAEAIAPGIPAEWPSSGARRKANSSWPKQTASPRGLRLGPRATGFARAHAFDANQALVALAFREL